MSCRTNTQPQQDNEAATASNDKNEVIVVVENSNNNNNAAENKKESNVTKQPPPVEHNPRRFGYFLIMLTSLLNFSACASVPGDQRKQYWILVSLSMGKANKMT
jgi:hypothetical protein